MNNRSTPWWRNRTKLPFVIFLAIAGYFLWTEHQAHVIEFLPWILVLGCLGMHLFMHGGHGHGGGHDHGENQEPSSRDQDEGGPSR
ncbi:MAG: DUF2933 domain-containing protein [Gammaproteobacteria bacterium]|nr:DUF2933 domain-containing protein [Acidobacteriota bacterium]NIP64391.1 DUF2933 domain-containing protein [Gammaproteobacteria bacterium]NIQ26797.1 DUF2933 domain-containing protein [Gammaproteobacteria bacterium]NIR19851.1 DUF2933 domain-containing protein [Gammaproteobacteria bacterium]NIT09973.1 DUF2933 domain-containing protein [Acidobacteriota bacterium]